MKKFFLDSKNTALFFIDVQEKLAPAIFEFSTLKKPLNTLLTTAKAFKLPIYVTEQYPKGLGEILKEFKILLKDAKFWEKTSFTALLPEVLEQIKSDGVEKLIVCGIETHVCVYQTVRDLVKEGFTVYLASDAVGSRSIDNKKNALKLMSDMGAIISNSETIAYDLLKDSKDKKFKEISQVLK